MSEIKASEELSAPVSSASAAPGSMSKLADVVLPAGLEAGPPLEALRGVVDKVFTSNARFSAGKLRLQDGSVEGFAGKLMVRLGDPVVLHGKWTEHPKFGRQFEVAKWDFDNKPSMDGLASYLAKSGSAAGIGQVKARRIAEAFGDDFERALAEQPEKIAEIAGVKLEAITALAKDWSEKQSSMRAKLYLAGLGLTENAILTLSKKYGSSVIALVQDDPYEIAGSVRGYGFAKADELAQKTGIPADHPGRIAAGLTHTIDQCLSNGHTWTSFVDVVDSAQSLLKTSDRRLVEQRLESLVLEGKKLHARPVDSWGQQGLSRPDIFTDELAVGRRLYALGPSPHISPYEAQEIAQQIEGLNDGQRMAVMVALAWNMSVITGAAGSGKTYVMGKIVDAYEQRNLKVRLCAPTGKAAKRMETLSGRPASTIHRMLGLGGNQDGEQEVFSGRVATGELDADLVVVDEASMIDVWLWARLFEAIDGSRTCVVFLGDHHQLPPVGPGNVLRDLVVRTPIPVVVLSQVVRQAGALKENSTAILSGQVRPTTPHKIVKLEDGGSRVEAPWVVDNRWDKPSDVQKRVLQLIGTLPEKLGVGIDDMQILAPAYKGLCGIDVLNALIQKKVQGRAGVSVEDWSGTPEPGGSLEEEKKFRKRPSFYEGDRVIWTKNDYELNIMNGTQGTVRKRYPDGSLDIDFGDGAVAAISKDDSKKLELAYCLSVHRAQGDQWPVVIAVVHSSQGFMLNRALIYTMVTRAQKTCVLVGDAKGMHAAVAKEEASKRRTWLSVLQLPRWTP
jgi:exodeoxyribonuclease V alpha subunit